MTSPGNKSDAKLVKLALKNSDDFAYLIERYEKKLMRYIQRFSGLSRDDAEDVLQEAFIKIYKNLNAFDPDLSFSSWAYRISHNETISYMRKHSNSANVLPLESDDEEAVNLLDVLCSGVDLPEEYSKKEKGEKVKRVLSMLSPNYRDILILKFLEDMSYEAIADILKMPIGTVGTLVNRAKNQFRQIVLKNNIQFN